MQEETVDAARQGGLAMVYYALGRQAESDAALAVMIRGEADRNAFGIAGVYAYRGQPDDAMRWLERAYTQKDPSLYDIKAITPEAKRLAELCLGCAQKVQAAVALLHNMDNSRAILTLCEEIDRLESDADHVMRAAMSKLFRDEPDVRNLIKLKAIYEILETVTDRCEDVANILEGIILENA